jgi:hypothetical protein
VTGEVAELEPFNAALRSAGAQVERNLATFEAEWEAAHPGEEPGPVVRARLESEGGARTPGEEAHGARQRGRLVSELADAGYSPDAPRAHRPAPVALGELRIEEVASVH